MCLNNGLLKSDNDKLALKSQGSFVHKPLLMDEVSVYHTLLLQTLLKVCKQHTEYWQQYVAKFQGPVCWDMVYKINKDVTYRHIILPQISL